MLPIALGAASVTALAVDAVCDMIAHMFCMPSYKSVFPRICCVGADMIKCQLLYTALHTESILDFRLNVVTLKYFSLCTLAKVKRVAYSEYLCLL